VASNFGQQFETQAAPTLAKQLKLTPGQFMPSVRTQQASAYIGDRQACSAGRAGGPPPGGDHRYREASGMNLATNLKLAAQVRPDHTAVKLDDTDVSYSAFADAAARVGTWLKSQGVEPGDRVGMVMPNVPQTAIVYYGILWAGGAVVPMNPLYKSGEVAHVLSDAGAKVIFAWEPMSAEASKAAADTGATWVEVHQSGFEALLAGYEPMELTDRDPGDTAVVLYTSGTTGRPKGAELTHSNMSRNAQVCVSMLGLTREDVIFGGLPLFHAFGQSVGLNAAVASGATITLLARFSPVKALEVLQRDQVTVMEGVPTMYTALLQHPERASYDTSALRLCVSGGAALPVEVLRGFEQAFDAILLEGYGLSETSPVASFNHPDRERKAGSIGQPVEGVEFRLIDADWNDVPHGQVGEIAIHGHNVMKGYLGKPEETAKAVQGGWFRTGDLARRDDDGYYFIVDRAKDLIIRGGYNVYPREVEEALHEHPAVAMAAVVGVPHESLGEEVAAAVVLRPGAAATEDELRHFVKQRIAAYKYPRVVWITDELPIGATGKILKREIRIPGHSADG
jgi:long-chain acyl-CoA synthetase